MVWIYAVCAAVSIGLAFVLVARFNVADAVVAEVATQVLFMLTSTLIVWRTVGVGIPVEGFVRIALANIPLVVAVGLVARLVHNDVATVLLGGCGGGGHLSNRSHDYACSHAH